MEAAEEDLRCRHRRGRTADGRQIWHGKWHRVSEGMSPWEARRGHGTARHRWEVGEAAGSGRWRVMDLTGLRVRTEEVVRGDGVWGGGEGDGDVVVAGNEGEEEEWGGVAGLGLKRERRAKGSRTRPGLAGDGSLTRGSLGWSPALRTGEAVEGDERLGCGLRRWGLKNREGSGCFDNTEKIGIERE